MRNEMTPTMSVHGMLDAAYAFFNDRLFDGALPVCLITIQRSRSAHGYFWSDMVATRAGEGTIDEIMMNGVSLARDPETALSTLVHEMAHVWQHHFGTPAKGGYHNKEWAGKMHEIGLIPSTTAAEGGAETGKKVSHYVDPDGHFSVFVEQFLKEHAIDWHLLAAPTKEKKKDLSKVKHTCPDCGLNVWGKSGIRILCDVCDKLLEPEDQVLDTGSLVV
jgi:hypothetical protein